MKVKVLFSSGGQSLGFQSKSPGMFPHALSLDADVNASISSVSS